MTDPAENANEAFNEACKSMSDLLLTEYDRISKSLGPDSTLYRAERVLIQDPERFHDTVQDAAKRYLKQVFVDQYADTWERVNRGESNVIISEGATAIAEAVISESGVQSD